MEENNEKFNKKIVREEEIKIPSESSKINPNKIINFLSSILVLIIIVFGIYFLMKNDILPNPFKIPDKNVVIPIDKITTTTTKKIETSKTYKTLERICPTVDNTLTLKIDLLEYELNFYDNNCVKTSLTGTYTINENTYKFINNDLLIEGIEENNTIKINYNSTDYIFYKNEN